MSHSLNVRAQFLTQQPVSLSFSAFRLGMRIARSNIISAEDIRWTAF